MQLNPAKPFAGIFATLVFMYLIYLVLAGDPLQRINRACEPVFIWPGKAVTSAVALVSPNAAPPVAAKFDSGFHLCRRWVWSTFYQQEYDAMLHKGGAQ